jgi:hypothetical protein
MNWPHGVQWEWAIGELALLGFLIWELCSVRRTQRQDREKTKQSPPETTGANPREN